jgi:hypothetical protein
MRDIFFLHQRNRIFFSSSKNMHIVIKETEDIFCPSSKKCRTCIKKYDTHFQSNIRHMLLPQRNKMHILSFIKEYVISNPYNILIFPWWDGRGILPIITNNFNNRPIKLFPRGAIFYCKGLCYMLSKTHNTYFFLHQRNIIYGVSFIKEYVTCCQINIIYYFIHQINIMHNCVHHQKICYVFSKKYNYILFLSSNKYNIFFLSSKNMLYVFK